MQTDPLAQDTLTVPEAAEYLKITPGYLHNLRHNGKGPKCERRSGRVFYRRTDLEIWDSKRKDKQKARADATLKKAQDLARRAKAMKDRAEKMSAAA